MKPCEHDSHEKYEKLIVPLRDKAKELGYAIGVHGSLVRDIDLIACPWMKNAVPAPVLAEALRVVAEQVCGHAFMKPNESDEFFRAGCPGAKPHGRLVWSFHLGGGPYIDLSVMPRRFASDWNAKLYGLKRPDNEEERQLLRAEYNGQFEPCCECGNDYPRGDLMIGGEIYCPVCRKREEKGSA